VVISPPHCRFHRRRLQPRGRPGGRAEGGRADPAGTDPKRPVVCPFADHGVARADTKGDLTRVLVETQNEPPERVIERLMPLVYDQLRAIAANHLRGERKDHTLQPTALVHEAFMRLVDQDRVDWKGRTHFYAVSAALMRRILIDHARARGRQKRGGGQKRILLESVVIEEAPASDVEAVHEALEALAKLDPTQARIVELRFFGGLTVDEVAHVLGVSKRKVEADWTHAKAWLRARLDPESNS
jgi:RNA polymerase sigma factor (TIGR02999 family)